MQILIVSLALLLGFLLGLLLFYVTSMAQSGLMSPLKESLNQVNEHIRELEKSREGAYQVLHNQVHSLKTETETLSRALHSPTARGRWGEIQLKRVVELAGMLAHCDFEEQVVKTTHTETIRPDLVIKLPGDKCVVVDAKVPLSAYLKATEQQGSFNEHAEQLKKHIQLLSKKTYWRHFESSPEFVVLFLPGETFLSAALSHQSDLIEFAAQQNVILATPMTLIALLRTIAYGFRQEASNEHAAVIAQKAKELAERLSVLVEHFEKLGKNLKNSVESYNQAINSFESRVLVSARQMTDLGEFEAASSIKMLEPIEKTPRC